MQPLGTTKITQPLGIKRITQPLGTRKIMQPLGSKKSRKLLGRKNQTTSCDQKITQSLGTTKESHNRSGQKDQATPWDIKNHATSQDKKIM